MRIMPAVLDKMIEFNRKIELLTLLLKFGNDISKLKLSVDEENYIKKSADIIKKTGNNFFDLSEEDLKLFVFISNLVRTNNGEIPRCIFRYDSRKHAKDSIEGKYIYMSENSTFNDPFEGILHADYENGENAQIFRYFLETQKLNNDEIFKLKRELDIPEKKKEYAEKMKKDHERNVKAAGIFCCSRIPGNITMWSHYAEKHQGVCLEYDILKDLYAFDFVNPVEYTEIFPEKASLLEILNNFDKLLLNVSLLTKSDCWENEQEIRVVKINQTGKIEINSDCLKSIIFGLRCPEKDKEEIINIMLEKGYDKNTEIKRAVKAENAYKLNIEKVGVLGDSIKELIK